MKKLRDLGMKSGFTRAREDMNKDIQVSISHKDDVSILEIKGDVTAITGESIEEAYQRVSTDGAKKILLYFDKDGYINSGGIAILIYPSLSKKRRIFLAPSVLTLW